MNYKLKELCEITSSNRIFAKEYRTFGIPFYRSKEVIQLSLKRKVVPSIFISENRYNKIVESGQDVPKVGDILITAIGGANRGYPWYVDHFPIYFKDGNLIWLRNFKQFCNSKFLSYYLSTIKSIKNIQNASFGTVQSAITIDLIRNINIYLPPLNTQQHIVNTIGSVDDLIENYQNQVKEILKVGDFLITKSSISEPLTKYADIYLGSTPSRSKPEFWNGNIKWINSGALTDKPAVTEPTEHITSLGIKTSATKPGNKGNTVLSIIEPNINKIAVLLDNNIYFNQSIICLAAKESKHHGLIYFASRKLIYKIKRYATGAAQQSLNKQMFEESKIYVTNKIIIKQLNLLLNKLLKLEEKIRILKQIKQQLLNKYF